MSVLNKVTHYQKKIERNKEHTETLLYCINKLHNLPITIRHLEKTGIGKTINELRRFDGYVGNAVKALVCKWKHVVLIEAAAEEHTKKEKDLMNPILGNSNESALSVVNREEEEEPTHIKDTNAPSSTVRNDDTKMLQQILKRQICSAVNLNCNDSEHESLRCNTLHQSSEEEDKADWSSYVLAVNQSSPKIKKQKISHHCCHSNKHHTCNRRDKPQHNKIGKEVDSELRVKVDGIKIKLEKVHTNNENNKQEEMKFVNSGSFSKHKYCSKQAEKDDKYLESKKRGQKQKTSLAERSTVNILKQSKSPKMVKNKIAHDDNIDYFGEALTMGDTMKNKRPSSTTTSMIQNSNSKSSPGTKTINIPFNSICDIAHTNTNVKLESLGVDIDLVYMLSEKSPDYNQLPHLPLAVETPTLKHDAKQVPLLKECRKHMKVYSGVKTGQPIPTLYVLSAHVLKENIDALEYTGGVPYDILKPILQQATPEQLFLVEYYNPYLIEETNELWEFHCRKEFRFGQLQPLETAREMYLRCLDEREAKLKALTWNIQQSLTKSTPVRKTKLAYVDSEPKPPQNVAKEQAKYGTGSISKSDGRKTQRSLSVLTPLTSTPSFLKKSVNSTVRKKPRLAPLMQKTMKLAKSLKR